MALSLHRPTRNQAVLLAGLALIGLTYGFFMRYQVIEPSAVGIACGENGTGWLCATRRTTIALFTPQVFGIVALGAALLNLLRPSVIFWGITLLTAASGLVLYNTGLSALAVAVLMLSLARPVPEAS